MWKNKEINIGRIKAKTSITVVFEYIGKDTIKEAKASCGCSVPVIEGNQIKVVFTAPAVSPFLTSKNINQYQTDKTITVTTVNSESVSSTHTLKFTGIVYE